MSATHHREPLRGYGLYLAAACLFGFNGTVSKTLLATGISAARLSELRVTSACFVLLVVVLLRNRASLRLRGWSEVRLLAGYGIAGVLLTQYMYFLSIHRIPVGITLIIEFTSPFMVAVWLRATKGTEIGRRVVIGMAVAFCGLVLVAQVWQGLQLDALGVIYAWAAAISLAVYFVLGEAATAQPYHRDSITVTMYGFAFASLVWAIAQPWWSFPWHYLQGRSEPWGAPGWRLPLWLLVCSMVLLGTVITFWLVVSSFKHISAAQASSFGMVEPVTAIVIAWALIGESLTLWQMLGIAVTGVGIFIAERSRMQPIEYVE